MDLSAGNAPRPSLVSARAPRGPRLSVGSQGPHAGGSAVASVSDGEPFPADRGTDFRPHNLNVELTFQGERPWVGRTRVPRPGEGWAVWATFQGVHYHGNTPLPREQGPGWLVTEAVTLGEAEPPSACSLSAAEFRPTPAACRPRPACKRRKRRGSDGGSSASSVPSSLCSSPSARRAPCPLLLTQTQNPQSRHGVGTVLGAGCWGTGGWGGGG